jgi:hypothetical protein
MQAGLDFETGQLGGHRFSHIFGCRPRSQVGADLSLGLSMIQIGPTFVSRESRSGPTAEAIQPRLAQTR